MGNEGTPEVMSLIKQKTALKSSLTRFRTFIDKYADPKSLTELLLRKNKIENSLTEFTDVCINLSSSDPENEDKYSKELEEYENSYFELIARSVTLENEQKESDNESVRNINPPNVKLPIINLPNFTGRYEEFNEFSEPFDSLINKNDSLTNTERFHYLKLSLKGEASLVIHSLELTDKNYKVAWNLLNDRYKNDKLIVQNHVKLLFNLPTVQRESAPALRSLLDNLLKHLRALTALGQPTESWDVLLIHLITSKLDHVTLKEWESSCKLKSLPTFTELTKFLQHRCSVLESVSRPSSTVTTNINYNKTSQVIPYKSKKQVSAFITSKQNKIICYFCKGQHFIYHCNKFLELSPKDRMSEIKQLNLCMNCLRNNHALKNCISSPCKICQKRHNTILHSNSDTNSFKSQTTSKEFPESNQQESTHAKQIITNYFCQSNNVILSTALVEILDSNGNVHICRALLDCGSQASFMTERLSQLLKIKRYKINVPVTGINQSTSTATHSMNVRIKSRVNNFSTVINFMVLSKLTNNIPLNPLDVSNINFPSNILLADPAFHQPNKIDLILGADIFWKLLCVGQINVLNNSIIVQKTVLGWIVTGHTPKKPAVGFHVSSFHVTTDNLDKQLQNFWKIEDVGNTDNTSTWTSEEKACNDHFLKTFKRTHCGRFMVELPFKQDPVEKLGESKEQAIKRFYSLERRLSLTPELKSQYVDFINEYKSLGHMELTDSVNNNGYFLPHHAVTKESTTTKLRVVFDASAKTTSGVSLNDLLMKGPTIQPDLVNTLMKFRKYKIALTADLEKMFRQILVSPSQTKFQKIIWRNNPEEQLKTYQLSTVTYGTTSAPFLAVRVMHQLAEEEAEQYQNAAKEVISSFYADDYLSGAQSVEEAVSIRRELTQLMNQGGFKLRKWSSNSIEVLEDIPESERETKSICTITDEHNVIKTLGLLWVPNLDVFKFSVNLENNNQRVSKRSILSTVARVFDPLGLIGPVIVTLKVLLQKLWSLNIGWDESLPMGIHNDWQHYKKNLSYLNELKIPRAIINQNQGLSVEIHGFSDASQQAYGACVYMRSFSKSLEVSTSLICSKSRVAPMKRVSLPRLELCGAVLLSQLITRVIKALDMNITNLYLWTDSTIVLAWINVTSSNLKTFVANRVSTIQQLTNPSTWGHVNSKDNPADALSRGMRPQEIFYSDIWWHGPDWLKEGKLSTSTFSYPVNGPDNQLEIRIQSCVLNDGTETEILLDHLIERYSSFSRLIRVLAYIKRFINNIKRSGIKQTGLPSLQERQEATSCLIKHIQNKEFKEDIIQLTKNQFVSSKSKLKFLNPFIDSSGLVRVGGRLRHSELCYDSKHPIVLPSNNRLSELIAREEHVKHCHAAKQSLLAILRQRFWFLRGQNLVKKVIHKCVTCFKAKPKFIHQLMGDLPKDRFLTNRPFINVGIDYCGPFFISHGKRRANTKSYVCVFVCFATKAVHLELVSDLTTESFIGALKRFISRRGKPVKIFSDNATTFVGANRELQELKNLFNKELNEKISYFLLESGIEWSFIPPRAPHMGGLWEAAVKSFKYHFKRIVSNAKLSFDEMLTVTVQIESCLNSRPLLPLSNDPNDFSYLSPAHFLIGSPLTALPEPDLQELKINRLSRWQRMQQICQHFWRKWSKEYLSNLQCRNKWLIKKINLKPGTMVLIQDDHLPTMKWRLGRVAELFPGSDGLVRVASVKTEDGNNIKRNISKLCVLPIEDNEDDVKC